MIKVEVVEDRASSTPSDQGFLKMRRLRMRNTYPDGTQSDVYNYDVVDRTALDAVVMVLHQKNPSAPNDPMVLIRKALRPPLHLRKSRALPVPDPRDATQLWELPAGLIEPDETGEAGILGCAARETAEETGYVLPVSSFTRLGPPVYLSPGLCAEKIHFAVCRIPDGMKPGTATLDGSAIEAHAPVELWPLSECQRKAQSGDLEDAKTELGLMRLSRLLNSSR